MTYFAALDTTSVLEFRRYAAQTDDWCDVFTDGSCRDSVDPMLRYASWAVIQADGPHGAATVIAQGVLPGLQQSAYRGELVVCRGHSAGTCGAVSETHSSLVRLQGGGSWFSENAVASA